MGSGGARGLQMKHIRDDHAFVYYLGTSPSGKYHGLRFSRGNVASLTGTDSNPELLTVGPIHNLPLLQDDITESIFEALGYVADEHPEVTDLLYGRMTLDQVIG